MVYLIKMRVFIINVWWFLSILHIVLSQEPVVNLPQGRVIGIKVFTEFSLMPIEVYFGIPYASAPIGRLRFSPPERHPGWKRTLFAHRVPPRCPQSTKGNENINEDCLYLNIWAPRELAAEGIVVVTAAYRLNILAFFSLKSIMARGNLALLDQYMSMIWVRENIAAFGGDPNAVTLLGHSAGAESVLMHMVSPRPVGLFQRAIIMSPRNIWKAIGNDNYAEIENVSRKVAQSLGCVAESNHEVLQCLRSLPLSDLMSSYELNSNWTNIIQPIPDDFLPESEQYLPISMAAALGTTISLNLKIDVLLGTTDLEAISHTENEYFDFLIKGIDGLYDHGVFTIIPELLRLLSLDRPEAQAILAHAIRWEFMGPKRRGETEKESVNLIEAVGRMVTSAKWESGIALLAARLARRASRLYVYRFSQPSEIDINGQRLNFTGATHGADLIALLGESLLLQVARRPTSRSEKQISAQFRKYVASFIKLGSPDFGNEWPRYIVGASYIHEVCSKELLEEHKYRNNRETKFWLQYLPQISLMLNTNEQSERITSGSEDNRFRGGVLALCGISVILLILLCASAILLYSKRTRRPWDINSQITQ